VRIMKRKGDKDAPLFHGFNFSCRG
jgi:hypothetical protein